MFYGWFAWDNYIVFNVEGKLTILVDVYRAIKKIRQRRMLKLGRKADNILISN